MPTLPRWLDPNAEAPKNTPPTDRNAFVLGAMERLLDYGCMPEQAAGVVANAANESAWGRSIYCGNGFGWKITQAYAAAYKKRTGASAPWWRARGNISSGDAPEVYYRVFGEKGPDGRWSFDFGGALEEWCEHFVPRPGGPAPYSGYRRCGELFWNGGDWFPELIKVGYKGPVTRANPQRSINEHRSIVKTVLTLWAQSRLGVPVDGKWGPRSAAAAAARQQAHLLAPTGKVDGGLLSALSSDRAARR